MKENQFVVFTMDEEEYAVDIMKVCEINRLKEINITQVPKVPTYIEGIINLRGNVVPVIHLRKKFGLADKSITKESRIIIIKAAGKTIGILVDGISHVVSLEPGEIAAPPEEMHMNLAYVAAIGQKGKRMIFLLDVEKMMEPGEMVCT
ncbi:MAG: chemotaxis protein CheW [Bacillota bacterium]